MRIREFRGRGVQPFLPGNTQGIEARLTLCPDPTEVAAARQFVADTLARWGNDDDLQAVVFLVSELVTNAVTHAGTEIIVTLRSEDSVVTVEVHDDSDRLPIYIHVSPTTTGGRGLHLVAAMSDDWGSRRIPGDGKVVWFSLAAQ